MARPHRQQQVPQSEAPLTTGLVQRVKLQEQGDLASESVENWASQGTRFQVNLARVPTRTESPITDVPKAIAQGLSTSTSNLPHAPAIQKSFGRHDISGIQFHGGSKAAQSAAEIGASAYTTGNHVVSGYGISKHTAAHEAAHYIQQKRGIHLQGGVGQVGDKYEQHADAVADAVIQGKSAESLLNQYSIADNTNSAIQQKVIQRRVGFEFEGQYNVRKVTNSLQETQDLHQSQLTRDTAIDNRITALKWKAKLSYANSILVSRHGMQGVKDREPSIANAMQVTLKPPSQWGTVMTDVDADVNRVIASKTETESGIVQLPDPNRDAIATAMQNASEITEAPLQGANIPKHGVIAQGTDFRLEADSSPTGGSNIEFVTEPLSTAQQVTSVVGNITTIANFFNSRKDQASIGKDEWDGEGGAVVTDQMVIYPFGGELAFEPQVTGGFRLDQMSRIMDYFSNEEKMGSGLFGKESTKNFNKRKAVRKDLNPTAAGSVSQAVSGAKVAVNAIKNTLPDPDGYKSLEGLIAMIANYIINGSKIQNGDNMKLIAAPFMSRTDFAHNFAQLPTKIRDYYRNDPDKFVKLALEAASLPDTEGTNLVANPTERGGAGNRVNVQLNLTREKWLTAITGGYDHLVNHDDEITKRTGRALAPADQSPVHKSLGALGTTDDRVGLTGKEVTAIIVELRKMRQGLTANELLPLAKGAFKVFTEFNNEVERPSY